MRSQILLYNRICIANGQVSNFKTMDLGAFKKCDPLAQNSTASESIT
jgi:hypothetical protein